MNFENLDRIENSIQKHPEFETFIRFMTHIYDVARDRGFGPRNTMRFFQSILGQQTTTKVFLHRNWIWDHSADGWVLFVDRRGAALHILTTAPGRQPSAKAAWEAFLSFRAAVESGISATEDTNKD